MFNFPGILFYIMYIAMCVYSCHENVNCKLQIFHILAMQSLLLFTPLPKPLPLPLFVCEKILAWKD